MPLNTNIALGVQPVQFESPMKMAMAANQLRESQLKSQEYEAALQERNALRQLNPNDPDYANQLARVSPTQGMAYRKSLGEAKSAEATQQKTQVETFAAKRNMVNGMMRDLSNRPDDENVISHFRDVQASPLFTAQEKADLQARTDRLLKMPLAERGDFLASQGATAAELRPQAVAPGGSLVSGGKAIYTAPEKAKTTDLMANYEAAKAQGFSGTIFDYERRIKEAGRTPPQPVAPTLTTIADPTNPGKSIVVDARTYRGGGAGSPGVIGAGGKDEKTAVSEQQAAYNIGRVLTAADQINKITKTDPSALKPGMGEAAAASIGMSGTANLARNANRQIVSGAQRDALDALLYLATGAAYNKEQLEGQMAAYIPSYTDEPETVAAKKTRMTNLIGSAKIRAGKAWTPQMESAMKSLTEPGASSTAAGKVTPAADGKWKDL